MFNTVTQHIHDAAFRNFTLQPGQKLLSRGTAMRNAELFDGFRLRGSEERSSSLARSTACSRS